MKKVLNAVRFVGCIYGDAWVAEPLKNKLGFIVLAAFVYGCIVLANQGHAVVMTLLLLGMTAWFAAFVGVIGYRHHRNYSLPGEWLEKWEDKA